MRLVSKDWPRRSVKAPDGKTHYLPCSPGEPGATAATLATLAENGLAENVRPDSAGSVAFASTWQEVLLAAGVIGWRKALFCGAQLGAEPACDTYLCRCWSSAWYMVCQVMHTCLRDNTLHSAHKAKLPLSCAIPLVQSSVAQKQRRLIWRGCAGDAAHDLHARL